MADGLVAFVPNPQLQASNNLTFTGMWFGIYADYDPATNIFSGGEGGIVFHEWLLLADPDLYPAADMASVVKALSVQPGNYVELRGPELAKVIVGENRMPADRGRECEIVGMPVLGAAKAKVEFRQGIAARSADFTRRTGAKITE